MADEPEDLTARLRQANPELAARLDAPPDPSRRVVIREALTRRGIPDQYLDAGVAAYEDWAGDL